MSESKSFDCYNLCVGTTYYWCVQKEGSRSEIGTFSIADDALRTIHIDGMGNIRDIGGRRIPGGRIRQNLVFRGSEADMGKQVTKEGMEEILRLGIRTEIDLRSEAGEKANYRSPMEPFGIKRYYIPILAYDCAFNPEQKKLYKTIFRLFTDKKSYPIYLHCVAGADRTGTIAFILAAFLGVDFDRLVDDYEISSLLSWGIRTRHNDDFINFVNGLKNFKGNTLQEQAADYLKTFIGLTDKQLDTIRSILIEPACDTSEK